MNWNYAYTPKIWPSFFTVLLLIALAVYSGRRRNVPGATWLMIVCIIGAAWATCWGMEAAALNLATRIIWVKVQGVLNCPIVTTITCFFLEYAWPGRWLTRRNLILLSIPCLLVLGLALTNDLYHLLWLGFTYDDRTIPLRSPINWMFVAYAFVGLELLNVIVFVWLFRRSPQHRWPVVLMLIGQIVGRLAYILDATRVLHSALPINVLGMDFEFLLYSIGLYGFSILDPIPLARQTAIEQLQTGMLVLDPQGRVVSSNPAALAILGLSLKRLLNCSIQELLPAWTQLPRDLQNAGADRVEISLGTGPETRCYQLEASALKDWRGLEVGRLLLLQDVTDQRRAQAQMMEQQKVVAALHERETLARELHDSLGQVLGYISLQAQAIRKRAHDGRTDSIETQLTRLAEVAQEAHKDIRESIINLKTGPVEGWSFFATLRGHLAGYQEHYGIRAELAIPEGLTEDLFETGATAQLLRVIQEALTNTRKHGRASCVQVAFACEGGRAQIVVADDGCGFDPNQMTEGGESHFGLAFMRERMEQIGGHLRIISQPGAGTRVEIEVPVVKGERRWQDEGLAR
jgi:PAS domain S-box-containing protein